MGKNKTRKVRRDVAEWDTFVGRDRHTRVGEVPIDIEYEDIADWLYCEYGCDVDWYEVIENGEVVYSWG